MAQIFRVERTKNFTVSGSWMPRPRVEFNFGSVFFHHFAWLVAFTKYSQKN